MSLDDTKRKKAVVPEAEGTPDPPAKNKGGRPRRGGGDPRPNDGPYVIPPKGLLSLGGKPGRMGRAPVDEDGLTPGIRRFVLEYVRCLDTTAAALAAGYAPYTALKADHWLKRPEIKRAIDKALAAVEKRYTLDAASILKELARVAMADPRRLFDEDGNVRPVTSWSSDDAACIAQVEVVKRNVFAGDGKMDTVMKIRLWDKPKTLEILAKHLGLLTERLEIRGDAELIEKLSAARKRVAVAVAIEE
jgi:phage terminase small subunit